MINKVNAVKYAVHGEACIEDFPRKPPIGTHYRDSLGGCPVANMKGDNFTFWRSARVQDVTGVVSTLRQSRYATPRTMDVPSVPATRQQPRAATALLRENIAFSQLMHRSCSHATRRSRLHKSKSAMSAPGLTASSPFATVGG